MILSNFFIFLSSHEELMQFRCHVFTQSIIQWNICDILPLKTMYWAADNTLQSVSSWILIRPTMAVCWHCFNLVPDCVPHPFLLSLWQMSASLWPQLSGACVVWHKRSENRPLLFFLLLLFFFYLHPVTFGKCATSEKMGEKLSTNVQLL